MRGQAAARLARPARTSPKGSPEAPTG